MAQTTISIRMDEELKANFDRVCDELGLSMSTAITIFAKKMSRENRIPFEVSYDPFYSENNMRALDESLRQLHRGEVVEKTMEELEGME